MVEENSQIPELVLLGWRKSKFLAQVSPDLQSCSWFGIQYPKDVELERPEEAPEML